MGIRKLLCKAGVKQRIWFSSSFNLVDGIGAGNSAIHSGDKAKSGAALRKA